MPDKSENRSRTWSGSVVEGVVGRFDEVIVGGLPLGSSTTVPNQALGVALEDVSNIEDVASGVYTTIPFNLVRFDIDEAGASGNQYVPATGIYTNTGAAFLGILNAKIQMQNTGVGTNVRLRFVINGVPTAEQAGMTDASSNAYLLVSQIANVPAGAIVYVQVYHDFGADGTLTASGERTYFTLKALSAAV